MAVAPVPTRVRAEKDGCANVETLAAGFERMRCERLLEATDGAFLVQTKRSAVADSIVPAFHCAVVYVRALFAAYEVLLGVLLTATAGCACSSPVGL